MKLILPALLILICCGTSCTSIPDSAVSPQLNPTQKRLNTIKIPEVDFRAANLIDCLDFLEEHIDQDASQTKTPLPHFVFDVETTRYLYSNLNPDPKAECIPLPTFNAKDISALQLMQILGEICRVEFTCTPELIIVSRTNDKSANKTLEATSQ